MADDLYHDDYYAWTLRQVQALRARKAGENALDYDNLAEEIEDWDAPKPASAKA